MEIVVLILINVPWKIEIWRKLFNYELLIFVKFFIFDCISCNNCGLPNFDNFDIGTCDFNLNLDCFEIGSCDCDGFRGCGACDIAGVCDCGSC